MFKIIRQEPALIAGAVAAAVTLALTFGVKMSVDQVGAISAAVAAVLALVVRSQVTPVVPVAPIVPLVLPPAVLPAASSTPAAPVVTTAPVESISGTVVTTPPTAVGAPVLPPT